MRGVGVMCRVVGGVRWGDVWNGVWSDVVVHGCMWADICIYIQRYVYTLMSINICLCRYIYI